MSYLSIRSVSSSSGTCSTSSHVSTPAPLTPNYFPNVYDHPLPDYKATVAKTDAHIRVQTSDFEDEDQGSIEYMDNAKEATPTRRSIRQPTPSSTSRISRDDTSSPFDLSTPPSIQSYSSALRETMRKRYDEAYKRMANGDGKMALDLSWEDEDPIDSYVRMTNRKSELDAKDKAKATRENITGLPSGKMTMLGKAGSSSGTHDDGLPPARPTLLDFRGNSHLAPGCRSGDTTPGSICSEASFEGYSREDWIDMYGRSRSSDNSVAASPLVANTPLESPNISFRMSMASISTLGSNTSSSSQATVLPPRMTTTPANERCNTQAYSQPNVPSPSHLFAPLPTPAPLSALATGYFAIPTQTAPAPVGRAYPLRPTLGTRQRSRNHPYANALEVKRDQSNAEIRPPVPSPSGLGDYPDRSESELMVIRAGLRSQRTRAGTRV